MIQTALELAAPWPLKVAVDHAIESRPLPEWLAPLGSWSPHALATAAAAAGVLLVAMGGVVRYGAVYLSGTAAERIGADIRSAVFERLLRLSLRFHDRHRSGDLVSRVLSDVPRVQEALVASFHSLIPNALSLLGMLAVLVAIDSGLALAALGVVPLLALQIRLSRPRIKTAEREVRDRCGGLATQATEVLRHVRAVQAFAREDEENRRFRTDLGSAARAAVAAMAVQARYAPYADLVLAAGAGLILVLGVGKVVAGELSVGVLLVVLSYVSNLYHPIRSLTRLTSILARAGASRERLEEIFGADELVIDPPRPVAIPQCGCSLALRRVTFGYHRDAPVLRTLSLEITEGETLCIVGPSGAGKSTLLSLLLRLYDPIEGSVTIGGTDIRRVGLRALRSRIALVPQDAWILDGTIAENIRFGDPGATDEAVRRAAGIALVDEFASRLPNGYDTVVGEGGGQLSGGQRRRLALARALLRDAPVLLLDEPTTGLDAESEAAVLRAVAQATEGRTVVIVSHHLKLAVMADRVIVLQAGRIAESGGPARLLESGGAFARLWAEQSAPAGGPPSGLWTAGPVAGPLHRLQRL